MGNIPGQRSKSYQHAFTCLIIAPDRNYVDYVINQGQLYVLMVEEVDRDNRDGDYIIGLPGGSLNKNETHIDAARRELHEETNISIDGDAKLHDAQYLIGEWQTLDGNTYIYKYDEKESGRAINQSYNFKEDRKGYIEGEIKQIHFVPLWELLRSILLTPYELPPTYAYHNRSGLREIKLRKNMVKQYITLFEEIYGKTMDRCTLFEKLLYMVHYDYKVPKIAAKK